MVLPEILAQFRDASMIGLAIYIGFLLRHQLRAKDATIAELRTRVATLEKEAAPAVVRDLHVTIQALNEYAVQKKELEQKLQHAEAASKDIALAAQRLGIASGLIEGIAVLEELRDEFLPRLILYGDYPMKSFSLWQHLVEELILTMKGGNAPLVKAQDWVRGLTEAK